MKPVSQIYSLIVETLEGYDRGEGFFSKLEHRLRQEGKMEEFITGKVHEEESKAIRFAKRKYAPLLNWSIANPKPVFITAIILVVISFVKTLDSVKSE